MAKEDVLPLTGTGSSRFFYGYVIVAFAFLVLLLVGGVQYTFGVFFKPLASEFGWSNAATSGAFSIYMVMSGIFTMITGRLNDRFGPRVVLTVCSFFTGGGLILMSRTTALWQLYLFYGGLVSIGMSGTYFPMVSTVARWFVKNRGMMTGIAAAGVGFGTMIFPPLASGLISSYGWRNSYVILGVISWAIFLLSAQFLRRDPARKRLLPYGYREAPAESHTTQAGGFSAGQAMRTVQFWLFCVVYFFAGVSMQAIMIHIVPHTEVSGFSAMTAATILTTIGGLSIAGKISSGSLGDKVGNKTVLIGSLILMTVALGWLLIARQIWAFYLFAVMFGLAYGGVAILHSPLVAEMFGLKSHSTILGIIGFAIILGGAVGSLLAGALVDLTGNYDVAFLIFSVLNLISVVMVLFLKPVKGGIKNGP